MKLYSREGGNLFLVRGDLTLSGYRTSEGVMSTSKAVVRPFFLSCYSHCPMFGVGQCSHVLSRIWWVSLQPFTFTLHGPVSKWSFGMIPVSIFESHWCEGRFLTGQAPWAWVVWCQYFSELRLITTAHGVRCNPSKRRTSTHSRRIGVIEGLVGPGT